jgi:hypothetical protein
LWLLAGVSSLLAAVLFASMTILQRQHNMQRAIHNNTATATAANHGGK